MTGRNSPTCSLPTEPPLPLCPGRKTDCLHAARRSLCHFGRLCHYQAGDAHTGTRSGPLLCDGQPHPGLRQRARRQLAALPCQDSPQGRPNFPNATLIEEEVLLPSTTVERAYPQFSPTARNSPLSKTASG